MDTRIKQRLRELDSDITKLEREVIDKSRDKKLHLILKHIKDH